MAATAATFDEAVAIEDGMDGTDRGQVWHRRLLPAFLADLGRAPAGILALEADDSRLERGRPAVGLAEGPTVTVGQGLEAAILIAVEDLVASLARDAELGAQRRHLFALE
jgi:hypothetical protein